DAVVGNRKDNPFTVALEADDNFFGFSVLDGVVDGFLREAKEMVLASAVADDEFVLDVDGAGDGEKLLDGRREFAESLGEAAFLEFDGEETPREVAGLGERLHHEFVDLR